jgi:hypothetical protein
LVYQPAQQYPAGDQLQVNTDSCIPWSHVGLQFIAGKYGCLFWGSSQLHL